MSLKKLVENQCGTANSLVELSSHFVQDRALTDQGLLHPFQHENYQNEDDQVVTYMENTQKNSQSFRMDSLLSEMRELEVAALTKSTSSSEVYTSHNSLPRNENTSDWANQYLESGSTFAHIENKPYQQNIWSNEQENQFDKFGQLSRPLDKNEFDLNSNWGQEFFKQEIPSFLDETEDSKFQKWANESVSKKMLKNDAVIVDETTKEKLFSQWGTLPMSNINNDQHLNISDSTNTSKVTEDVYSKELWTKLTERWEQLNIANQDPWDTEFNKFVASVQSYAFVEENPMANKVNPLEEGKKRLDEGDLSSAVLCFEAAVTQNPESIEGWQLLGRTQAENEQDQQAIAALKKCIHLDPGNLEALKELAVCYTNENYQYQACYILKEWLARNPKYQDIVKENTDKSEKDNINDVTSILSMKFFNEVLNLYLKAVQRFSDSNEADADIQNGLGVLLTLNSDYGKAIDCFETAVKIRPNDSRLWNRLGATLANGQKPEQALEAYRKTLKLSPGFIRARYNLGITCVHLQMYNQAVEHLLIALNQQVAGRGIHGEKSYAMSESIWTTLKLALSLSGKKDLISLAEKRKSVIRHLRAYHENNLFQCPYCNFKCDKHMTLIHHKFLHTGGKPYVCLSCGYKHESQSRMKEHIRKHTGERPFLCFICGKKFTTQCIVDAHVKKIHTAEKKCVCADCGYSCTTKRQMMEHVLIHICKKKYICPWCEYSSDNSANLRKHIRQHTGEKPFKCSKCEYRASDPSNIREHLRKHNHDNGRGRGRLPFPENILREALLQTNSNAEYT
ncbi:hypothetical protein PGB90_006471 [Kerria lacca]